jgi:DNA mismatch repair protein MutS
MLQQYLSIKEQYKDAILFYRMGDFYEMFFEDAKIASKVLEIALTSRNKKDKQPVPMCGFPHKAASGYIARLIKQGHKVAICDQTEDPGLAKGLVKREVVRVITPGMITDDELLDEKSNNYVLAVAGNKNLTGLSCLDISTGRFRVTESKDLRLVLDESLRISPSEILLPESFKDNPDFAEILRSLNQKAITFSTDNVFEYKAARQRLLDQFNTLNLEGFGCDHLKAGVKAAGALLHYVVETQKQTVEHFTGIETYSLDKYLMIDHITCRNLELLTNIQTGSKQGTLVGILDKTITAMGGRLLKDWIRYPLLDPDMIMQRLDAVEEAKNSIQECRSIREIIKSVYDLERVGSKISMGHANARDLIALKRSLKILPQLSSELSGFNAKLFQWQSSFDNLQEPANLIEKGIREDAPLTINEGGIIKTEYNPELDELIQISRDGKGSLAKLETKERKAVRINSLKVRYNKVFGYYIEIPKTHTKSVPGHYVRKQTLVNAERYITDELKTFESKVLGAEERRAGLEYRIFNEIRQKIAGYNADIQELAGFIARIDCLLNLGYIAEQNDYNRPEINLHGDILINDGRHPVVEKMIAGERFVPNTIEMDQKKNQILVITGPNMAGKSTILRQIALLVIMAQVGSFVPAGSALLSITDRIFTRVGALDNLSQGQSTFLVEMQETANILNCATSKSLIVMDEIGRGTSTFDGLSIAWAVAEYLHDFENKGIKTLFATHYHELTELSKTKDRVQNFNIAVKEYNDEIIFLRKLVNGGTNRSYGIQVARLAGIPGKVIERAKKVLSDIERKGDFLKGPRVLKKGGKDSDKGHVQLEFFKPPEKDILQELQMLDISQITPLDALNRLNELHEKANKIRG